MFINILSKTHEPIGQQEDPLGANMRGIIYSDKHAPLNQSGINQDHWSSRSSCQLTHRIECRGCI
jgi:hypothetical protein